MAKRIFDTYHAPENEIQGVKDALDAAGISYYETQRGKWGVGSAALWLHDASEYQKARAVIDQFQQRWVAEIRQHKVPRGIHWARLPALLITLAAVLYLTFFWYKL